MNILLLSHEWLVVLLAIAVLLVDLWLPVAAKPKLGYFAAAALLGILAFSFTQTVPSGGADYAFSGMYVVDGLSLFFKRFFLLAGALVMLMTVEFSDRVQSGISEYYTLILFALSGMLFASSANNMALLFVSLELITVSFYILTSFQRSRMASLEAGVKYLIIGALSTGFTVFGIALIAGVSGQLSFDGLAGVAAPLADNKVFLAGLLLLFAGLGFKIAAFPFQVWAPDVYQGAPSPTTAFLAVGSKAAGFVLLLRVLFAAVPDVVSRNATFFIVVSAATILYGNLGALAQRNIKRLLGYSSIAQAGYLLMGIAALSAAGKAAVLYYLGGYLFTVLGAFIVICVVFREAETEDMASLAGLNQRSPLLATAMVLAMVSLAGIPPLAGFFGKFLLIKAAFAQGQVLTGYYWLVGIALIGVVISLYYYFNVIRSIYWPRETPNLCPILTSLPMRLSLIVCMAGMVFFGVYPSSLLQAAERAVALLK